MASRYDNRNKAINKEPMYDEVLKDRGVNQIRQYTTPILRHPTAKERKSLERVKYSWTSTSKIWRLAEEFYGAADLGWIILWYNQKPTEAHFKPGDIVEIPLPLERILGYLKV